MLTTSPEGHDKDEIKHALSIGVMQLLPRAMSLACISDVAAMMMRDTQ